MDWSVINLKDKRSQSYIHETAQEENKKRGRSKSMAKRKKSKSDRRVKF